MTGPNVSVIWRVYCKAYVQLLHGYDTQICQGTSLDSTVHYDIAYQGGEEIWIDNSKGPYLYYTGPGNRYSHDGLSHNNYYVWTYVLLFRESKVYLHCDRSLASGEEKLTTTGDTITKLTYVRSSLSFLRIKGYGDG